MFSAKQICTLLIAGMFFAGCETDGPADTNKKSNIATPSISSKNSNFTVSEFHAAKSYETSQYVTAVAQVKYTGNIGLNYVEVFANFKNSSGEIIYKDSTYLWNETTVATSNAQTTFSNAFVTPDHSTAYYVFIDEVSFAPSEIASVEFSFDGNEFTPVTPGSKVELSGTAYENSDEDLCQNIINNGTKTASMGSCMFILKNSAGISYDFTYPEAYVKQGSGYVKSEILAATKEGRLATDAQSSYFETQPLTVKKTLLDWETQTVVAKKGVAKTGSPDEIKKSIREMRNEILSAHSGR